MSRHPETHILFTFDTFEALNVQQTEDIHRRRNEDWVQDLIAHFPKDVLPNCFFMICGRDQLKWDADWEPFITQFELKDFSKEWAESYLVQAGVVENDIRSAIMNGSRCLPFYLYLSAKTYIDIKNRGTQPNVNDFGESHKQIIQRFIYNLSDDEVRTLKYLAVPNFFTAEIFVYLLSKLNIASDPERFEQIIAYSFIKGPINGRYYIHSLMRDGLTSNTASYSSNQVNSMMLDYYEDLYAGSNDMLSFTQMMYHASLSKDLQDFRQWFNANHHNDHLRDLQLRGEQAYVLAITENLIRRYGIQSLSYETINIYIDVLHLGGNYEIAVDTSSNYLSSFSVEDIIRDERLFRMRIRQIHNSMFFTPVQTLIKDAEALLQTQNITEYPEQYAELLFLIGGNLGVLSGDFHFANDWITKAMTHAKQGNRRDFIIRNLRKSADLDTYNGNPHNAIQRITEYITVDSKIDKRYEIYLLASLGEAYRKALDFNAASRCFDVVGIKCKEKNMSGWIAHSKLAKASLLYQMGQYEEARSITVETIRQYCSIRHVWGEVNAKTLLLLCEYMSGEDRSIDINELSDLSLKMGYDYNTRILDEIMKNGKVDYFQLFFL